jgi:hypothetical protein
VPDRAPEPGANGVDQTAEPDHAVTRGSASAGTTSSPAQAQPHAPPRAASRRLIASGRYRMAERRNNEPAKLADATRAQLRRIATEFERAAADHTRRMEQILDQVAAQRKAVDERVAGLDQRDAEFVRLMEEGFELLDARLVDREDQLATLETAATAWLDRIERAGRKRRRSIWRRRAGPPATAVMLAIAAAVGGTLMVRGGGNDRSNVADAAAPQRSRPAAAANASTTTITPPATDGAPQPDAQPQPDATHWSVPGQSQLQQQGQASSARATKPATAAPGSGGAAAPPAAPQAQQPQQQSPSTSPPPSAPPPQEQPPPPPPQQPGGPLDFLDPVLSAPGELLDGLL